MPFSHHSHSGQFCSHAKDKLEDIIQAAIKKRMEVFAMTEHMPREKGDLYPEEVPQSLFSGSLLSGAQSYPQVKANETPATLSKLFDDYYHEAVRLRGKYTGQIMLLVGMEIDWIRPSSYEFVEELLRTYQLDIFIGSVHHVHGIPTDYNRELHLAAREKSGGTDERLFEDYFDLQLEMLQMLKPPVVGHFDLIRLWSDDKDGSFAKYKGVWQRILRNLDFVVKYGGVLEINSAALRKGMREPYPQAEICKEFLARNGQFALSDDSHGIAQIATHYNQTFEFLESTGIDKVVCFERGMQGSSIEDSRFPRVSTRTVSLAALKKHSSL